MQKITFIDAAGTVVADTTSPVNRGSFPKDMSVAFTTQAQRPHQNAFAKATPAAITHVLNSSNEEQVVRLNPWKFFELSDEVYDKILDNDVVFVVNDKVAATITRARDICPLAAYNVGDSFHINNLDWTAKFTVVEVVILMLRNKNSTTHLVYLRQEN